MLCSEIEQINRFNICEKVNDLCTIGKFKIKQNEITDSLYFNGQYQ